MKENGLAFVEKQLNAPNVPQARPIEKFWVLCKRQFALRSKVPKNITGFKRI